MNFLEACQSAKEGNFVSHKNFDRKQSMHVYNGDFYYEDGPNLTKSGFIYKLKNENWAKDGWYVKYSKEKIDREKLKIMHNNNGYMLYNESYEDCIIQ